MILTFTDIRLQPHRSKTTCIKSLYSLCSYITFLEHGESYSYCIIVIYFVVTTQSHYDDVLGVMPQQ